VFSNKEFPKEEFVKSVLNLLSEELKCDNEECNGYPVVKQYICWALGEIGDDSSEVIELLVEVVKQRGWISAPEAIKTLTRFGFDKKGLKRK
jgi:hypothetical protein